MLRNNLKRAFLIILCISLALCGVSCNIGSTHKQQKKFDQFMQSIFINEVNSDTLELNYSLAHPENYGIEDSKATLGDYGISCMKEELIDSENYLHQLLAYDYNKLSPTRQLTYHIVKEYLEDSLSFGKYLYYNECLGPTTGVQAQLPILLAEYGFNDKKDIEEYLKLLPCVKGYFRDIIQYEREKSAHGLFMKDSVALRIIDQCKAFIQNPDQNFLITYFNERITGFKGLTKDEKSKYEATNQKYILTYVIPAYQNLIDALYELIGTGTNPAGLYYYPQGQAYYECLARYKTGSNKSMEEMIQMLENAMQKGVVHMGELTLKDPALIDKFLAFHTFPLTDPVDILADLKKDITKDFPAAVPVNCAIKYVPESLADFLSPAMYLVPPMDNFDQNDIYINGNNRKTLAMIYTTVAHEGYPGHLYQCTYFRSKKPAPIRNILNFTGYDEGWATYVEYYSYRYAGIDNTLADFMATNNMVILCMYARADIGIHYEGWTREATTKFITSCIGDEAVASTIYDTLLEEPGIYLPYAIGYLEIEGMRSKAETELGNKFEAKAFHKFLLDIGPAPYDIINDYLEEWINKTSK